MSQIVLRDEDYPKVRTFTVPSSVLSVCWSHHTLYIPPPLGRSKHVASPTLIGGWGADVTNPAPLFTLLAVPYGTILESCISQVCYVIKCFFRGKIDLKTVLESSGGLLS